MYSGSETAFYNIPLNNLLLVSSYLFYHHFPFNALSMCSKSELLIDNITKERILLGSEQSTDHMIWYPRFLSSIIFQAETIEGKVDGIFFFLPSVGINLTIDSYYPISLVSADCFLWSSSNSNSSGISKRSIHTLDNCFFVQARKEICLEDKW